MSFTKSNNGRLGNQIIRNLALSLVAEKNNLYVDYSSFDLINNKLGIKLFVGEKKHKKEKIIKTADYLNLLNKTNINYNCNFNKDYFQSEEITDLLYNYLRSDKIKNKIIKKNPYKDRYRNNEDLFIHVRLGDISKNNFNINIEYYIKCIKAINFNK